VSEIYMLESGAARTRQNSAKVNSSKVEIQVKMHGSQPVSQPAIEIGDFEIAGC
jgi:hypothetical protein